MQVRIFGPNLSLAAQRKGEMHVHTADCADCKKYGPGKPMGGEDDGWTVTVADRKDCVLNIYPPSDFNYDETAWVDFDDLYVAPCVKGWVR